MSKLEDVLGKLLLLKHTTDGGLGAIFRNLKKKKAILMPIDHLLDMLRVI